MQSDTPVLILPGIGNSRPQHWLTLWELRHPQSQRVNLGDWDGPVCEDWIRALDVAVQTCSSPPVLMAHCLACLLVAHWAHHSALVPKAEEETEARARSWIADGKYSVLLARDGVQPESLGFLALYGRFALYTEGAFGTIPEFFYVRRAYRSQGVGTLLLSEAKRIGKSKGWRRFEVTTPPLPQFDGTLAFY